MRFYLGYFAVFNSKMAYFFSKFIAIKLERLEFLFIVRTISLSILSSFLLTLILITMRKSLKLLVAVFAFVL